MDGGNYSEPKMCRQLLQCVRKFHEFTMRTNMHTWCHLVLLHSGMLRSRDHAGLETENCGLGLGLVLFGLGLGLGLMKMLVLVSRMSVSWSRSDYRL